MQNERTKQPQDDNRACRALLARCCDPEQPPPASATARVACNTRGSKVGCGGLSGCSSPSTWLPRTAALQPWCACPGLCVCWLRTWRLRASGAPCRSCAGRLAAPRTAQLRLSFDVTRPPRARDGAPIRPVWPTTPPPSCCPTAATRAPRWLSRPTPGDAGSASRHCRRSLAKSAVVLVGVVLTL